MATATANRPRVLAPWVRVQLVADAYDLLTKIDDRSAQEAARSLGSYLATIAPDAKVPTGPSPGATGAYRWEQWAKAVMARWRQGIGSHMSDETVLALQREFLRTLERECERALKILPASTTIEKLDRFLQAVEDYGVVMGVPDRDAAVLGAAFDPRLLGKVRGLLAAAKSGALATAELVGKAFPFGKAAAAEVKAAEAGERAAAQAARTGRAAGAGRVAAAGAAGAAAAGAAGGAAGGVLATRILNDTPGGGFGVLAAILAAGGLAWYFGKRSRA